MDETDGSTLPMHRRAFVGCVGTTALSGCGYVADGGTPTPETVDGEGPGPPGDASDWSLTFEDRFEGDDLDTTRWRDKYPWDARTHNYDAYAAPENVDVEDGRLVLRATDEPRGGKSNSTGVVSAKSRFKFGYAEARLRVPEPTAGYWPAFWLTRHPSNWPPEIDVLEFFGSDPRLHVTYHYGADPDAHQSKDHKVSGDFGEQYHVYAVDWRPDRLTWYVDGAEVWTLADDVVRQAQVEMSLVLNFGLGTDWLGHPGADDLPATYEADWVRFWERDDG